MSTTNRYYGILLLILFLSASLLSQQRIWSQNDNNQLSPYEVYLQVQDDDVNRVVEKTTQWMDWSVSAWKYKGRSNYEYTYYNSAMNNYALQYYYYSYYSSDTWNNSYYYNYHYNTLGYLSGWDYYGWNNNAWELWGSGIYSNHNAWGEWGKETYTNLNSMSGRESYKIDRYFDSDGNVTDFYYSFMNGNDYEKMSWANTVWSNGYYDSKKYYDWNNSSHSWDVQTWYQYYYAYGYVAQVPQSNGYLYRGSPSSWTEYKWTNGSWDPYQRCSFHYQDGYDYNYGYGYNNGYTTMATYHVDYNPIDDLWPTPSRREYFSYHAGAGKPTNQMDLSNFRLKLVERAVPGASADEWDKNERVWMSYENEGYKVVDYEVATESEMSVPSNFQLKQNYPNPFNPVTTINFDLSENSNVKLSIYDMTGRLINELVNTEMNIGNHSVYWNGLDINGNNVGAGIYLYKLQTDNFTQTKKMILLR